MKKHINIIARTNGVGLDQDVDLIHSVLTDHDFQVTISHCRSIPFWKQWLPSKDKYDANIFLERVFPRWFNSAEKNILIPNQERYPHRHISRLNKIDHVLCKTRHAEEIFSEYAHSEYIGFSSNSKNNPEINPDYSSFFHLAGRSTLKGTEALLNVWNKHPEWPTLTIVQHAQNAPDSVPENVNLITDYLSYEALSELMNISGIHCCPSLSEGWGHYIVEAMSCSAVVLTTDAPPMNEIISANRGVLVPSSHSEPRHLGRNFFVSEEALEQTIEQIIITSTEEKQNLGNAAKGWFIQNQDSFKKRLTDIISKIL